MESQQFTKDYALQEIRKTLGFLYKEKLNHHESIELNDLLNKKLERKILNNFKGVIIASDYENIVYQYFGEKQKSTVDLANFDLAQELKNGIFGFNIRNKNALLNYFLDIYSIPTDSISTLREMIDRLYNRVTSEYLGNLIFEKIEQGVTNKKNLLEIARREGFDLNTPVLSRIIQYQVDKAGAEKKSRLQLRRQQRRSPEKATADKPSEAKSLYKERMQKSLWNRIVKWRSDFVNSNCRLIKFEMIDNIAKDGKRIFIHRANYRGSEILIQSIVSKGEIENVSLAIRKTVKGKKLGNEITMENLLDVIQKPKGVKIIRVITNILGFENLQEEVWFLGNIFGEKSGIPQKSLEYIQEKFIPVIRDIDSKLMNITLQKLLSKS